MERICAFLVLNNNNKKESTVEKNGSLYVKLILQLGDCERYSGLYCDLNFSTKDRSLLLTRGSALMSLTANQIAKYTS